MNPDQLCFLVDTTRCINCKTCEIACKDQNGANLGQRLRRVHTFEGGEYPNPFVCNLSMACNHCERPRCAEVCPADAYRKRDQDGIVVHDPERCIGCQYCTWACPFGAPQFDPGAGRVMKCNLCVDLIDAGEQPACVAACPLRAIELGRMEELQARPGVTMAIRNLPSPALTDPNARYKVKAEMRLD